MWSIEAFINSPTTGLELQVHMATIKHKSLYSLLDKVTIEFMSSCCSRRTLQCCDQVRWDGEEAVVRQWKKHHREKARTAQVNPTIQVFAGFV